MVPPSITAAMTSSLFSSQANLTCTHPQEAFVGGLVSYTVQCATDTDDASLAVWDGLSTAPSCVGKVLD